VARNSSRLEIHLLFEHIDAIDGDLQEVADLKDLLGFPPAEASARGFVDIEVAFERGDMDEAGEQKLGQLDEEAEIPDIHNHRAEFLAFAFGGLELEELEFFEADGFLFGIGGGAFGGGDVFGHGTEGGGIRAAFGESELALEGAVDDEVAVAPDGACEMGVVRLREAIVAEGLRKIAGALEALEEGDLHSRGEGFAMQGGEEFLKLGTVGEVACSDALRGGKLAELGEFVRVGFLMDTVNGGLLPVLELAGDEFVGEEHEFLDELVGDVVLHALEAHGAAGFVEPNLDLGKLEIERSCGEAFLAEQGG